MAEKPTILLVEDDENLGYVISDQLRELGYAVTWASHGVEGWIKYQRQLYDLCLVDVMMPEMDGFTLVQSIRSKDEFVPIIFLTAKSMEEDRLRGFEIGGDDYLTKPFSMPELAYRIKVFLRRSQLAPKPSKNVRVGAFELDMGNLQVSMGEQVTHLTQREADLLQLLVQNQNMIVAREEILVKLWGENDYFKGRSLDVFVSRLRKYLKADPNLEIRNHHGVGFSLKDVTQ